MIRALPLLVLSAGPAQAGTFPVPPGCSAYLSVQLRSCEVTHHWTCDKDPKGTKWSAQVGQNGPEYIGKVDHEAQWIDSYFLNPDVHERLIQPAKDPASLTELFATGLDTYQFSLDTPNGQLDVNGFDRLVERDLQIDGQVLHRTEYSIRITNAQGALTYEATGSEYVSETHRRFFSGYGTVSGPDTPYDYDSTPVEFIAPGDDGFLDNTPRYGCDVISASARLSERIQP